MRNLAFITVVLAMGLWSGQTFAQTCTPQICAAMCSTPSEDNQAFKSIDKAFIEKLKKVSDAILKSISSMDTRVADAVQSWSRLRTMLFLDLRVNLKKDLNAISKKRQQFRIDQQSLDDAQFAKPGKNLNQETVLKSYLPMSEALTRAMRQQLYEDHVRRVELEHEQYYKDKSNLRPSIKYEHGTISGYAKLYATHKDFFCNAGGAQKPPGCGDDIKDYPDGSSPGPNDKPGQWVKMGDQMVEIYLGDGTWPKERVQQAIELMQYYLGISPPDLPNTATFRTADGQRGYLEYQAKLAKNNFLTYIMSYLVAKRAPTNSAQASIVDIRKEAAGCEIISPTNQKLCAFLNGLVENGQQASHAQLSRSLQFDQFMNPAYIPKSFKNTLGVDKDITMLLVDRIQQDYEEYQMDKMITAAMAGYYASLVNGSR